MVAHDGTAISAPSSGEVHGHDVGASSLSRGLRSGHDRAPRRHAGRGRGAARRRHRPAAADPRAARARQPAPGTQAMVLEALDGLPLTVTPGTSVSSVVAVLDGDEPGPTVLLRGDMDALPMPEDTDLEFKSTVDGAMHACGHDAHVAMLAGAAKLLSARRGSLRGAGGVHVPARRGGLRRRQAHARRGAARHRAAGAEPVTMAFAIHQSPSIPSGMIATKGSSLMASADSFLITVRGRGGHASMPHQASDPIPIACEMVGAFQSMVTRRVDVFDPAVVTVGSHPGRHDVERHPRDRRALRHRPHGVGEGPRLGARRHRAGRRGIAAAHGATAEISIVRGYPVTVNDPDAAAVRPRHRRATSSARTRRSRCPPR